MNERPQVKCPKCAQGLVPISDAYFDVLKLASEVKGITAHSVRAKLDKKKLMNPTAFNNRLQDLVRMGYLRRERKGREWCYFQMSRNVIDRTKSTVRWHKENPNA